MRSKLQQDRNYFAPFQERFGGNRATKNCHGNMYKPFIKQCNLKSELTLDESDCLMETSWEVNMGISHSLYTLILLYFSETLLSFAVTIKNFHRVNFTTTIKISPKTLSKHRT